MAVPDLTRLEVTSVIRRQHSAGLLTRPEADLAIGNLIRSPLIVYPTGNLLARIWELQDNITPYDACYVALAESLNCPLITADLRLARAPGTTCDIETM